jgi:hypothetical protein
MCYQETKPHFNSLDLSCKNDTLSKDNLELKNNSNSNNVDVLREKQQTKVRFSLPQTNVDMLMTQKRTKNKILKKVPTIDLSGINVTSKN